MRISNQTTQINQQNTKSIFSRWILDFGDGKLPTTSREGDSDSTWIEILDDLLIRTDGDRIAAIVLANYTNFLSNYQNPTHLCERAILTPTNEVVDEINSYVLSITPGDAAEYLSCDSTAASA